VPTFSGNRKKKNQIDQGVRYASADSDLGAVVVVFASDIQHLTSFTAASINSHVTRESMTASAIHCTDLLPRTRRYSISSFGR
jgi:hypothetical protein